MDLPGYGHAKTDKQERERFQQMIAAYLSGRANLMCVFVLIDSRHTPQQIDLEFVQWLAECGVTFVLVFTKADKLKATPVRKNIELFQERMSHWCADLPEVFTTSSKTRAGRLELLDVIDRALAAD